MKNIVSVIQSEKGVITSACSWLYSDEDCSPVKKAEDFFVDCLKANTNENFTEEQIEEILDDGFYDCDNGYSVVIYHGELKN